MELNLEEQKGISDEQIQKAISLRSAKIDTDTDLRSAITATMRKVLRDESKKLGPQELPAKYAMKKVDKGKMRLLRG